MVNDRIPTRRDVLRRALALGCGVCLPAVMSGCDSNDRRSQGQSSSASGSSGSSSPAGPPAAPSGTTSGSAGSAAGAGPVKVAQASVNYQAQPNEGRRCADCQHFIAESGSCKLVEGQIVPDGWCTLWAKRS